MLETMEQWFAANVEARTFAESWLDAYRPGTPGKGVPSLIAALQTVYGFPYKSPRAFMKLVKGYPTTGLGGLMRNVESPLAAVFPEIRGNAPTVAAPVKTAEIPRRSDHDLRSLEKGKTFLISSAVEGGTADPGFLAAARQWRSATGGEIMIHGLRYVNPTRRQDDSIPSWDPALEEFLYADEIRPHPRLSIMPTMIQATANNPLPPRLTALAGECSTVFGHPQLSMRTAPVPHRKHPKMLYTTGAMTWADYSDTLAGAVAKHHHKMGAVVVEVVGNQFHMREVSWDGEKFIDYDTAYYANHYAVAPRPRALIMGDIHKGVEDAEAIHRRVLFDEDSLARELAPRELVLHDVDDARHVNRHEANDPLLRARAAREGTAMSKLAEVAEFIREAAKLFDQTYVVRSNHHDFWNAWLSRAPDPIDDELWSYLRWSSQREERLYKGSSDIFRKALNYAAEGQGEFVNTQFLKYDESLRVADIECGMHGHLGVNGTRGTPEGLSQMGAKYVIGDKHSPRIWHGGYVAGVCGLRHGYNKGPSGWFESMVLIHDNGKRQFAHYVNGRYRR